MRKIILISISVFCLIACNNNKKQNALQTKEADAVLESEHITIGVVNTDTILEKYTFAIQARESMTKKAEDAKLTLNTRAKQLQKEMAEFQNKVDNNAFLSRERAEQEAARLQKKQADIQQHGASLEDDFMQEQQRLSQQLKDSIDLAIKEINKDKRFSIIVSTSSLTDNVLYADKSLNITNEILVFLNSRIKR